jgi:hypothetical protein
MPPRQTLLSQPVDFLSVLHLRLSWSCRPSGSNAFQCGHVPRCHRHHECPTARFCSARTSVRRVFVDRKAAGNRDPSGHVGGYDPQLVQPHGVPIRVPKMSARRTHHHQPPRQCHPMALRALRASNGPNGRTLRSSYRTASPRRE